jgi:hypothetical protein
MALSEEIQRARTHIASDGYEMSVGEVMSLYREREIVINPAFQRLFRWDASRKTRFIESLLLGIPIPPIFVYQNESGVWELIDGLQRLSTIFEFVGVLRQDDDRIASAPTLDGTRFLPSLAGKKWEPSSPDQDDGIGHANQLQIKRARIRVEILKSESDPKAKFELFQRLNTGGAVLSEQEVRNCVAVMLNKEFFDWIVKCSMDDGFRVTIDQTDNALKKQSAVELALRFFVFRNVPYRPGLDVHEYLDEAMIQMATDASIDMDAEGQVFLDTFRLLHDAMGGKAFKRWDGTGFRGKFLMSVFEVVAIGVSRNLSAIKALGDRKGEFVEERCKALWSDPVFDRNSGAGVRGTTRLANLLPMAETFFRPQGRLEPLASSRTSWTMSYHGD